MTLMRWDPFREMAATRRLMDRWLEEPWTGSGDGQDWLSAPVDIVERDEEFEIRATVPGFAPDDIEITVQGDVVTLKGERTVTTEREDETYRLRERRSGSFQRTLRLPCAVETEGANAHYENGELTLTVPKQRESVARRIKVDG